MVDQLVRLVAMMAVRMAVTMV